MTELAALFAGLGLGALIAAGISYHLGFTEGQKQSNEENGEWQ